MTTSHEAVVLKDGCVESAYVSRRYPKRLIVFVHGFLGKAATTWDGITEFDRNEEFWRESDLLFIQYKTIQSIDSISALADGIALKLRDYYPTPKSSLYKNEGGQIRENAQRDYLELYLVGHSLGGVIVKQMVLDDAVRCRENSQNTPFLSDSQVRLFSPAHGGFKPTGALWYLGIGEFFSAWFPYLSDLSTKSTYLLGLNQQTLEIYRSYPQVPSGLRNHILWANPEHVVVTLPMINDSRKSFAKGRNHVTVCKPSSTYKLPWTFISDGQIEHERIRK